MINIFIKQENVKLSSFAGAKCANCEHGYYNLTADNPQGCSPCECNPQGSTSQFCDPVSGQCQCKDRVTGRRCDQCIDSFQDFDQGCVPCSCDPRGTIQGSVCNKNSGQCVCKENVQGLACDECKDGSFGFGSSAANGCFQCICDLAGTVNGSTVCDKITGKCVCKANVRGTSCNQCSGNTFGLSKNYTDGCELCNCDPSGTKLGNVSQPDDLSCDQNTGACTCLANRVGRRCEDCAQGRKIIYKLIGKKEKQTKCFSELNNFYILYGVLLTHSISRIFSQLILPESGLQRNLLMTTSSCNEELH